MCQVIAISWCPLMLWQWTRRKKKIFSSPIFRNFQATSGRFLHKFICFILLLAFNLCKKGKVGTTELGCCISVNCSYQGMHNALALISIMPSHSCDGTSCAHACPPPTITMSFHTLHVRVWNQRVTRYIIKLWELKIRPAEEEGQVGGLEVVDNDEVFKVYTSTPLNVHSIENWGRSLSCSQTLK